MTDEKSRIMVIGEMDSAKKAMEIISSEKSSIGLHLLNRSDAINEIKKINPGNKIACVIDIHSKTSDENKVCEIGRSWIASNEITLLLRKHSPTTKTIVIHHDEGVQGRLLSRINSFDMIYDVWHEIVGSIKKTKAEIQEKINNKEIDEESAREIMSEVDKYIGRGWQHFRDIDLFIYGDSLDKQSLVNVLEKKVAFVLEDECMFADMIGSILRGKANLKPVLFSTGKSIKEAIKRSHDNNEGRNIQLVWTDWRHPSGYNEPGTEVTAVDVIDYLKIFFPWVYTVFCSGANFDYARKACHFHGFDLMFSKPLELPELIPDQLRELFKEMPRSGLY